MKFWRFGMKQKLQVEDKLTKDELVKALGLSDSVCRIALGRFAVNCAISLIAGMIAKCEFRTYYKGKRIKGDEYYLWNVRPNPSQNSTQFLQELIYKLCWKNEVLVFEIGEHLYIADDFIKTEYAVRETEFSNIRRGTYILPRKRYLSSDVIYLKLNNENIANLVNSLQARYDELISEATDRYIKSGGEKIVLQISTLEREKKDFNETVKKYMNEYFKTYFSQKNAVLPLFEGYKIDRESQAQSKSDVIPNIAAIKKESMDAAAQGFKIPPAIMRGDIADVDNLVDNFLTFGIDPLCCQIEEEITSKRYTKEEYLEGSRLSIDTTTIKHIDIFSIAANIDKLIADGVYNVDGILEKLGDEPRNTPFSQQYVRTKNYEAEGGDKDAENS